MEKIKVFISVILGVIASFVGKYGIMILLVAGGISFDCITGLIKAKTKGELSSSIGTKGFFKKMALMVCLFFGFYLDYVISYICNYMSLELPIKAKLPFAMIMCFYIVLNESISICENLYACYPGIMPKWIVGMLKASKDKLEDSANENTEKK